MSYPSRWTRNIIDGRYLWGLLKKFLLWSLVDAETLNQVLLVLDKSSEKAETNFTNSRRLKKSNLHFQTFIWLGLEGSEFKEENVAKQTGLQYKLFHRDPVTVLKKQMAFLFISNLKESTDQVILYIEYDSCWNWKDFILRSWKTD